MPLKRILEPEVMDSQREAQEYNEMDHSEVNERFVSEMLSFLEGNDWFATQLDEVHSEDSDDEAATIDVLDLGTGTALIPIELCERTAAVRVMAIDMATSMLELARYNIEANSMSDRVELAKVDAKSMTYPDGTFDLVMSNSIIHHIPEPQSCIEQIVRVARTDGAIFVRDLMRPEDESTLEQLVEMHCGQETDYSQQLFRDSLHAALSLDEIRSMISEHGFSTDTVTATSDRHWTWAAFTE